jgi:hypothetical protein
MTSGHRHGRPSRALRGYALVAGPLSGIALAWWVVNHAFGPELIALPLVMYGAVVLARPDWWLVLLPALWPIADLARWTGQIHVTESDALALATVACLSFRHLAPGAPAGTDDRSPFRAGVTAWVGMLALAFVAVVGIARGMSEFPPASVEAWTGYSGSMNAVRVGKGWLLPMLLVPFLHSALRRDGDGTFRKLAMGLAFGLGTAALAAVWERLAFPGLTDFAQDYRTTAMFWEMHVGGAALDGWFALSLPFALYAAWSVRRSLVQFGLALSILAVGGYAVLTTFSRGLYLAVLAGLACLCIVVLRARTTDSKKVGFGPLAAAGAAGIAALAIAILAFRHGGYRGAAALLVTGWLTYVLAGQVGRLRWTQIAVGLALGVVVALAAGPAATLAQKGVYLAFALAALAAVLLSWHLHRGIKAAGPRVLALAVYVWTVIAAVAVPVHWGGDQALPEAVIAAALVAIPGLVQVFTGGRMWTPTLRGATVAGTLAIGCVLTAAVFGSYYLQARASTTGADLETRLVHWRHSASLVQPGTDEWLGVGSGRFSEAYFWNVPQGLFPGTWRILDDGASSFLRLGPPRHMYDFGEMFRVTQAVPLQVRGPFTYRMRVRAPADAKVRIEVCRRHLLYTLDCVIQPIAVKGGDWQSVSGVTGPGAQDYGPWFAPRLAALSLDLDGGVAVDVTDLEVLDGASRPIVRNGDFRRGTDGWFFSSDRNHLPWHAKNLALHAYVENGLLGLIVLGGVLLTALGRLAVRSRAGGLLAGVPLAALLGFLCVGLFDSLLDIPRLTFWLVMVLWLSLVLRRHPFAVRRKVRREQGDHPAV